MPSKFIVIHLRRMFTMTNAELDHIIAFDSNGGWEMTNEEKSRKCNCRPVIYSWDELMDAIRMREEEIDRQEEMSWNDWD